MSFNQINKNRQAMLNDIIAEYSYPNVNLAVEVGTWKGDFSLCMINTLKPNRFFAVDPYRLFPGMVSAPGNEYNNQADLDALADRVSKLLAEHNATLLRDLSVNACKNFADDSIDVVYIDGDHTYDGVVADLNAWWPKVRFGGIFCGDDYVIGKTGKGYDFGVIEAVNEFAENNNLTVDIYTAGQKQWLIRKPHV